MSKVASYHHIVFCTKYREMTLEQSREEDLYRYIWKIIQESKSTLVRIGGIANHIHILIDLHPEVALATLVRDIKSLSSGWIRVDRVFRHFQGWAKGYFACSVSPDDIEEVKRYIMNQKSHHSFHQFDDELIALYQHARLKLDTRDMQD